MSQNLRNYTKALYGFDAVIQRVPDDRWDAASPCEGWSARDVVVHAIGVMEAVMAMIDSGEMAMPQTPAVDGDVVDRWNTTRDAILEAVDRPGVLDKPGSYWSGESRIDDLLAFTTSDPLVHGWDVARATGLHYRPDPALAERTIEVMAPFVDMLRSVDQWAQPPGGAAETASGNDPMGRLLAMTGRDPNR